MKKKNIAILSCNKMEPRRFWSCTKILILISLLFPLLANLSCQKQKGVEPKSKANSPPVITSVNILPEKPYKGSELNVVIQSNDPDRDSVVYQYQWIKNDEEIVGENKNVLRSYNFKKGDLIRVKITPNDGKIDGNPFLSSPVKILNSPPVVQEVWIEPKVAYINDNLKAFVKGFDTDGDFIYYTYQWVKNGVVLQEERKEVLEKGLFKKEDSITVIVTSDDRELLGISKKSDPIIISNSPPIIVSSPPTSVEGAVYQYQVKAEDPDHDPIIFTLKAGPKGMKIDQNIGLIQWEMRKEDKGSHSIEIEVSDNEGVKSIQRYTLLIEFR
jgi:hypothetical protein